MLQRWLVAIIGLPLLLLVLLACPPWATALLVCAIAGVAAYELLHVAGKNVPKAVLWGVILSAAAQCWLKYAEMQTALAGTHQSYSLVSGVRWATVMLLFFAAVVTYGTERAMPFSTVAAGVVGGIVFPALYTYLILLRVDYPRADLEQAYGQIYILAPFFIAFAGDSLAMYFGMWFGKKKLTPVSPKKTWAGFWGGVLGSVLGMLLLRLIAGQWLGYHYPLTWLTFALTGAVANVFGQLGDLSMSLIKREAGVKDYSHLFLTHGGMLDRFDSTMFIAPVVYFFHWMTLI